MQPILESSLQAGELTFRDDQREWKQKWQKGQKQRSSFVIFAFLASTPPVVCQAMVKKCPDIRAPFQLTTKHPRE
jgi:hypothetical protein